VGAGVLVFSITGTLTYSLHYPPGQVTRQKTHHLYNLQSLQMTDVSGEILFYTEGNILI